MAGAFETASSLLAQEWPLDDHSSPSFCLIVDRQGIIQYVTANVISVLGFSAQDICGKNWREFVDVSQASNRDIELELLERRRFQGDLPHRFPVVARNAAGQIQELVVCSRSQHNQDGEVISSLVKVWDLTQQTALTGNGLPLPHSSVDSKRSPDSGLDQTDTQENTTRPSNAVSRELVAQRKVADWVRRWSGPLLNRPVAEHEQWMHESLSSLAAALGATRAYTVRFSDNSRNLQITYDSAAAEVSHTAQVTNCAAPRDCEWIKQQLNKNRTLLFCENPLIDLTQSVRILPRELIQQSEIAQTWLLPLRLDEQLFGALVVTLASPEFEFDLNHFADAAMDAGRLLSMTLFRKQKHDWDLQRLRNSLDLLGDGGFECNVRSLRIQLGSRLARTIFGSPTELQFSLREAAHRHVHSSDLPGLRRQFLELLADNIERLETNVRLMTEQGYRYFTVKARVIARDAEGAPTIVQGTCSAPQRRSSLAASNPPIAAVELPTQASAVGEMLANVAHEVAQPLRAAAMFCEATRHLLSQSRINRDRCEAMITNITEQLDFADNIVQRLRELFRGTPTHRQWLDVSELIADTQKLFATRITASETHVTVSQQGETLRLYGDSTQLRQLFGNLIVNACEAMQDVPATERELQISIAGENDAISVTLRDTGPAAMGARVDAMFSPFFSTKHGSLGMGLTICRQIVDAHSGELLANANPERGMSIFVRLPRVQPT